MFLILVPPLITNDEPLTRHYRGHLCELLFLQLLLLVMLLTIHGSNQGK